MSYLIFSSEMSMGFVRNHKGESYDQETFSLPSITKTLLSGSNIKAMNNDRWIGDSKRSF